MATDEFLDLFLGESRGPDPMRAAQKGMGRELPKRFYREAAAVEDAGVFALTLDGRPARTPARHRLAVASRRLGEALAAEWAAQGAQVDPETMPLTRLVNVALDRVALAQDAVRAEIAAYADSDLLCYRAIEPDWLVTRQADAWGPVLDWAAERLGARFLLVGGIMPAAQPEASLAAVRRALAAVSDPLRLAALSVATTLTGSVLLALALADGAFEPATIWAAAHVDEDAQAEVWGHDEEAMARRAARKREFDAAALVLTMAD